MENIESLSNFKHGENDAIKTSIEILTELVSDGQVDMLRITIAEVEELINLKLKLKG